MSISAHIYSMSETREESLYVRRIATKVAARYGDLSAASEWPGAMAVPIQLRTHQGEHSDSALSLRLKKMKEAGHQCGVNEYNYLLKAEFLWNDMG